MDEKTCCEPKDIKGFTEDMEKHPGFFTYYWDDKMGKIWLEVDKLDQEFLYYSSLKTGVGSKDIGLDKSQLGTGRSSSSRESGPRCC